MGSQAGPSQKVLSPAAGSECDVGRKGILGPEWEVREA